VNLKGACTLMLAAGLCSAAMAQPIVQAVPLSSQAFAEEPLLVEVRVSNFRDCETPVFPEQTDFSATLLGPPSESSGLSINNGRRTQWRTWTYTFEIIPHHTGALLIPRISVEVDGKTRKTRPLRIRVQESDQPLLAEITTDEDHLYVGQHARFTLKVFIKPVSDDRGEALSATQMYNLLDGRRNGFGRFPPPSSARQTKRVINGELETYYEYAMSSEYTLDRTGPLAFDDVELRMRYPTRIGRDRFFGDRRIEESRIVRARLVLLVPDVLALPSEGRPSGFNGAVGSFTVSATAKPSNVRVGDPIELILHISGRGPLETLPGPILSSQEALTRDFRVPSESLAGAVVSGRKRFTQVLRAKHAGVKEIPSIEFPYFDPAAGEYRVARSAPVPISVTQSVELDASDLGDIKTAAPADSDETLDLLDGLRGNKTDESLLLSTAAPLSLTQVWIVTAVPPGVFALALGLTLLGKSNATHGARRRRQRALKRAVGRVAQARNLDAAERTRQIESALVTYLADRMNEPPARFTGPAAIAFLEQRGVGAETLECCRELLRDCEASAYAGGASDESLAQQASECLTRLERERL